MKKYFLLALSLVLIFTACNKTPTPQTPGKADILRTGKWKISSGTFIIRLPNGLDTTLDYMKFMSKCHQDDYIVFDSGMNAAIYNGATKCNPSEADHIPFLWKLTNNDNYMDLYNGFTLLVGARDSIYPFGFDTLVNNASATPPLVLDTPVGGHVFDTVFGYARVIVINDTTWQLHVDTANFLNTDIYNAQITNFSQTSFTLNYDILATYPDTTKLHMGLPHQMPIWRSDTFKYSVTYTNF
jgi:hypothetical protein